MKVLYVVWEYPKLSETFVAAEIEAVVGAGADVRVLSARRSKTAALASPPTIVLQQVVGLVPAGLPSLQALHAISFDDRPLKVSLWAPFAVSRALKGVLRSWTPDVVHAPFANHPATMARVVAHVIGTPWSMMAHARDWLVDTSPAVLRKKVDDAAVTFAISETTRAGIAAKIGATDAPKVVIVRAAVAAGTQLEPVRRMRPYVAFAGRLVPKKGVDLLIRAYAAAGIRDVDVVIVGDGPERETLCRLARELGVERRVDFRGAQDNATVRRILAGAVVVAHPSRDLPSGDADGIPVVLMEAGLLGVPVITTNCGAIGELIEDNLTGTIVPSEDVTALAEAIRLVVADPQPFRTRALALKRRVETEFSAAEQAQRLLRHWSDAVRSGAVG